MRVLWVTNDLPPRAGGIQQFVANLLERVHPGTTLVVGPDAGDAAVEHDVAAPYEVVRHERGIWPTPGVLRLVRREARRHRPDVVVLGASWPLGELAGTLTRDLGVPVVGLTHGLEAGLASAGLGWLVGHATRRLALATTISDWTETRLRPHLRAPRVERLPPGVDVDRFDPQVDGAPMRTRWGIPPDAMLVGCISRMVRRKGQDRLLDAWPDIAGGAPDAWLVLVGSGPLEAPLRARAATLDRVVVAGEVAWEELPRSYAALDLFVMPCRTRWGGLDVEGLGIVYLEAQASGVPAVGGRSGGAPEAIRDGVTGLVVDGRSRRDIAGAVSDLLDDPSARAAMGVAGREWAAERWSWDVLAARFEALLAEVVDGAA